MAVISLLTAEDLLRLPSDLRCELIDGVLVELSPPGSLHGVTAGRIAGLLFRAQEHGLGCVMGEAGCILRRNPDLVRAPDVAFIRQARVPPDGFPKGYWRGSPDLVVEVVSPFDTASEIQTRVREWIEGGALLVLVVYPETRVVEAVRSLLRRERFSVEDTIDLTPAVPGFSLSVAEIFA